MSNGFLPRRLPLILVRFGRSHARLAITVALITWALAGLLAWRIKLQTDILSLVPQSNPIVQDFKSTIERFGTVDTLLVVLRLNDGDREGHLAYADLLAQEMDDWDLIEWVEYRMDSTLQAVDPLLDRSLLFLPPDEVAAILDDLEGGGLRQRADLIYDQLVAPQGMVAKELVRVDLLGVVPRLSSRLTVGGLDTAVDPETGYLIDSEGRFLLMLARPVKPAQDLPFDRELAAGLKERVATVSQAWRDEGWEGEPPAVETSGGYAIALDDARLITSDAISGMATSLIGVMLLFLIAFRRLASLVYAFVPLATGLGLTFAFGALTLGRMNSLTSAFGGLLVGLGIDFIIVLYGRYVEERQAGQDHATAVDAMGQTTGVGVLLGAVTTAATFYAFLVTEFQGLWELGLLTGTGILLLAASVYVLLPALLTLLQNRRGEDSAHHVLSFGVHHLVRAAVLRPWPTVAVCVAVTVLFGFGATALEFDDDIRNMRSPDNRGSRLQDEVMAAFDLRFTPMSVRVDGETEAEVFERARRVLPDLEALVDGETLGGVDSIAELMPPMEQQQAVIALLEERDLDAAAVADGFRDALRAAGLNPAGFASGLDHMQASLNTRAPLSIHDLEGTALEHVISRSVARHDEGYSLSVRCFPPAGKWMRMGPPALAAAVDRHPGVVLTGTNIVSAELRRIVWRDAGIASVVGMIAVFILLWLDLGRPGRAALSLVPLGFGMVWMLGAMAFLDLKVNFMNIFVMTMVIGIGVDYGVHLLHRWHESDGDPVATGQTSKAIVVAALTTMVGFGSLVLSHYPGLRSVGAAAILGALATAVLSVSLLPAMLRLAGQGGHQATGARSND
jgi:predicted RND superfamily exporter protein